MKSQIKQKKLRYGMIGGGPDSFIGPVHRLCVSMEGLATLVSGCFSSNFEKSLLLANELGLDEKRIYTNAEEMIEKESKMPNEERLDFIAIVSPNYLHFPQTKLALNAGFHVILDKPLCNNLEEALELEKIVSGSNKLFCLTHTYTGYPMIKEAKSIVASGKLGKIRKVVVEYPQGWLSKKLEDTGHKGAEWRSDPKKTGKSCCLGDIGTHAFNLAEYVLGLKVTELNAEISTFVEGRIMDDDASVMLRFENGVKGTLMASQILTGEENSLGIRVWGELGGLEWNQRDCNTIIMKWPDRPWETLRAGTNYNYLSKNALAHCRTPGGHPEGYLEAFTNIYRNFVFRLLGKGNEDLYDFPGITEGVRGMTFIERCLESSSSEKKWTAF